jgi:hypothetical protein
MWTRGLADCGLRGPAHKPYLLDLAAQAQQICLYWLWISFLNIDYWHVARRFKLRGKQLKTSFYSHWYFRAVFCRALSIVAAEYFKLFQLTSTINSILVLRSQPVSGSTRIKTSMLGSNCKVQMPRTGLVMEYVYIPEVCCIDPYP